MKGIRMKDNARYLELGDEQLEQVVGGSGGQSIHNSNYQLNKVEIEQHVEAKYVAVAVAIVTPINVNVTVNLQENLH